MLKGVGTGGGGYYYICDIPDSSPNSESSYTKTPLIRISIIQIRRLTKCQIWATMTHFPVVTWQQATITYSLVMLLVR